MADKARDRNARLAQALKQNLKRRKAAPTPGTGHSSAPAVPDEDGLGAGTGPQKGLRPLPGISPKTASKRN